MVSLKDTTPNDPRSQSRFSGFVWGVLGYNLLVIAWGAFVRATGSGAGCGNHWPLCDGQVIPQAHTVQLVIEFTHRMMSGIAGLLVVALFVWARRLYPKGAQTRKAADCALFFMVTEALLGAALVKFHWVVLDASPQRVIAMSLHLINTFVFVGSLAVTAILSAGSPPIRLKGQGAVLWGLALAVCGLLALGVSGAVTALGDTLFPVHSLMEGLKQDLTPTAHFLIRLRLFHPLIAMSVGLYLILIAGLMAHLRPSPRVKQWGRAIGGLFLLEIGLGLVNVWLLAPIWMQLIHLLVADLNWVALILLSVSALGEGVPQAELAADANLATSIPDLAALGPATWKDYLALTKPKVISLLLFTTLTAMVIAKGGWPGTFLFLAVAVGGYMAAGAANAINMVIDRDIDGCMKRTASRPTVTQKIPSRNALFFAMALAVGAFGLLWAAANMLSAMLALAGLVFYVIIYTLMLKRRTWHNIVIGGAAGAFPPLVGWAAVTGDLSPLAWSLFAIIFVWTPVHFWALALMIKDDYASVGVPMLPVVRGDRVTVIQIGLYAILTAIISILPLFLSAGVHSMYLVTAIILNIFLLARSLQLYQRPDRPHALTLYKYSMVYLALLFLMMAVDRAVMG